MILEKTERRDRQHLLVGGFEDHIGRGAGF
jgi:hypothetical protein